MKLKHIFATEQRLNRRRLSASGLHHDRQFVFGRQVVDQDIEHEPVELRFRQWIGAFHFDWVLSRQHKERFF